MKWRRCRITWKRLPTMGHPGGPGGRFFGPPPVVDQRRHHQRTKSKPRPSRIMSVACIVNELKSVREEWCISRVYIKRKRWHTDIRVNEFGLRWLIVLNNLSRRNYCQYGVFKEKEWLSRGATFSFLFFYFNFLIWRNLPLLSSIKIWIWILCIK